MLTGDKWTTKIDYMRRVYSVDDVCPTIATVTGGHGDKNTRKTEIKRASLLQARPRGVLSIQPNQQASQGEDGSRKEGRFAPQL